MTRIVGEVLSKELKAKGLERRPTKPENTDLLLGEYTEIFHTNKKEPTVKSVSHYHQCHMR